MHAHVLGQFAHLDVLPEGAVRHARIHDLASAAALHHWERLAEVATKENHLPAKGFVHLEQIAQKLVQKP